MTSKFEQIYLLMSRYHIRSVEINAGDMLVVYKNGSDAMIKDVGNVALEELEGGFC